MCVRMCKFCVGEYLMVIPVNCVCVCYCIGDPAACVSLAHCCSHGKGVEKSDKESFRYNMQAAEMGA